jgi:hypothetical protein
MQKFFSHFAFFVMAAVCAIPMQPHAQAADTVYVAALPAGNINNVINGDTLAGGIRAHPNRVYKLKHGSVYQVMAPMNINGSITIIANDTTVIGLRPPVLAPAILSDNSSIDHYFDLIGKGSKVNISDIYLLSIRSDGAALSWSAGIRIWADSISLKLRRVVMDAFTESGVRLYASWSKLDIQDCHFRNFIHSSSYFGGQPIMSDQPNHMDTCLVINNTFFACNSYLWSIRGYDRHSVFEHNSVIYGVVNPFLTRQGSHLFIKNNLFYASHAYGGIPDHVINGWFLNYPDTVSSSIINIRTRGHLGPFATVAGTEALVDIPKGVTLNMLWDSLRTHDIRNNDCYYPTKLLNAYTAYNDTVATYDSVSTPSDGHLVYLKRVLILPRWINDYSQYSIDSVLLKVAPLTTVVSGNLNQNPLFVSAAVTNHIDALIGYIYKIATNSFDTVWSFHAQYPPVWPLPENLRYNNSALQSAGTDQFAVGDLNWFPEQKELWIHTGVEINASNSVPSEFSLSQNYPNPFNPSTSFTYELSKAGFVSVKVYDLLGREVATLVNEFKQAGAYPATWNAVGFGSGVYFFKMQSGSFTATKKMILMK